MIKVRVRPLPHLQHCTHPLMNLDIDGEGSEFDF